jgi:hypothetical protein
LIFSFAVVVLGTEDEAVLHAHLLCGCQLLEFVLSGIERRYTPAITIRFHSDDAIRKVITELGRGMPTWASRAMANQVNRAWTATSSSR